MNHLFWKKWSVTNLQNLYNAIEQINPSQTEFPHCTYVIIKDLCVIDIFTFAYKLFVLGT